MEGSSPSAPLASWREGFVLKRIRMLVPVGFKTEIRESSKLAGPVVIAQLMVFAVSFVSTIFCGHLGRTELAGVSLAIAVINVTGVSIGSGLASACDTLISQTFGSNNLLRVGVILQRAILILLLACFPCWAILVNTEPILLAVRQEPEVARLSQMYVNIFMPALPATFMYSLLARYLQNQGIIWPQVFTGLVVNLLNALINYIFLYVLDLGVAGSAVANTISQFSLASFLYAYIMWKGLHKATWGGLISEVELGAQAVVYELATVAYMFPLGFSIAGNVRVGSALGAGDTEQAKLSAKLTMFCAVSVSICLSIVIGGLHNHISYIFTYDEQIRQRVSDVIALYAAFVILDAIAAASGGIIRGTGKQKIGAICNILGYYGVGFPIGVSLMFAAKMGIKGLWSGLFICVFLQSSFMIFYLLRMNWVKATVEAQIRAGVPERFTDTSPQLDDPGNSPGQTDTTNLVLPKAEPVVEDELSFRALVLHRGLILALMFLILAAGIIFNLLITNLIT
ncbi:multidrug and toxin extrusion protein 1 isoform X2 [Cyclopterus lumpus]|uniref:multidrug and toxin extrusion protein 1 isoform X2 n=1 Tax=Cyclopterus lumpus TaxID=8103 RepID=UPI00148626E5|nr:multidrug and toxin extrusion protein 1 isoform X2 [Cyclopterus lumpus]